MLNKLRGFDIDIDVRWVLTVLLVCAAAAGAGFAVGLAMGS